MTYNVFSEMLNLALSIYLYTCDVRLLHCIIVIELLLPLSVIIVIH